MRAIHPKLKLAEAINTLERQNYQEGFEDGLKVAEQIRNYLTRTPDTDRQRQAREWADKLISKAREN
jgi:hypothetical protein